MYLYFNSFLHFWKEGKDGFRNIHIRAAKNVD